MQKKEIVVKGVMKEQETSARKPVTIKDFFGKNMKEKTEKIEEKPAPDLQIVV